MERLSCTYAGSIIISIPPNTLQNIVRMGKKNMTFMKEACFNSIMSTIGQSIEQTYFSVNAQYILINENRKQ